MNTRARRTAAFVILNTRREISRCNMSLSSKPINLRLHCDDLGLYYVLRSLPPPLSLSQLSYSLTLILFSSEPIGSAPKVVSAIEYARENIACDLHKA